MFERLEITLWHMVDYYMFYTVKISSKISRKRNVIVLVSNAKAMATHSSTLAWKIPWTKSLVGCSPWGCEELDTTERLHFHFSLSWIGEGNGNPLQCFAWRIPGAGEPGGLPSMGSHRVGHDWSDLAAYKIPANQKRRKRNQMLNLLCKTWNKWVLLFGS